MSSRTERDVYVARVLAAYRSTPGTTGQARAADRSLAVALHERNIPAELVEVALQLGALRRQSRDPQCAPLATVRALHYFLPVLDELLTNPPNPAYVDYIRRRLLAAAPAPRITEPHACGVDDVENSEMPPCHTDHDR